VKGGREKVFILKVEVRNGNFIKKLPTEKDLQNHVERPSAEKAPQQRPQTYFGVGSCPRVGTFGDRIEKGLRRALERLGEWGGVGKEEKESLRVVPLERVERRSPS